MARRTPIALSILAFFLLGSVAEQRARLPPAKKGCTNPVAGRWVSHTYFPHVREWYKFEIDLVAGSDPKHGTIRGDFWVGGADDGGVTACGTEFSRQGIVEKLNWTFDGSRLEIHGKSWKRDPSHACGTDAYDGYSLDHFTGVVDAEIQEFQALLNADGPQWTNVPIVFRRVGCVEKEASSGEPTPQLDPSPGPPPAPARGWACW